MGHFKLMDFLIRLAPFPSWKAGLLRRHFEKCPECERCLASREEARRVLVQSCDVGDLDRLWPAVSNGIRGIRPSLEPNAGMARGTTSWPKAAWRFAAAAAGLALAVVMTFTVVRFFRSPAPPLGAAFVEGETDQVQIHYVRIENEPAQTFIFKPHDSDVVIVWAGRNI